MLVKNLLRIIIVSLLACSIFFIGILLGFNIGVNKGSESVLNTLSNETIKNKINKPTTSINNEFENTIDIKKIKNKKNDSLKIDFNIVTPTKNDIKQVKKENTEELKNIFTSICIDTLGKTRRQAINELKKHYK